MRASDDPEGGDRERSMGTYRSGAQRRGALSASLERGGDDGMFPAEGRQDAGEEYLEESVTRNGCGAEECGKRRAPAPALSPSVPQGAPYNTSQTEARRLLRTADVSSSSVLSDSAFEVRRRKTHEVRHRPNRPHGDAAHESPRDAELQEDLAMRCGDHRKSAAWLSQWAVEKKAAIGQRDAKGETPAAVKEAGKAAVAALKAAGSLKGEELQKAIAKAKFTAASSLDGRDGIISTLGPKILSGSSASLSETISSLEKVDASAFEKATSSLLKAKPTYVAVGDITSLPYADELGL
ncbi:hypothetical protein NUW54_g2055 [Trametes sanguinea]|uniref:Uncharacterized protein n=1 Tax=Trametes sanguinea TaxID=158606 RepID=A0ACC1Q799_9APHY|nr:hypothetical protein NUW54_g2055 [Trametes sanguinea]